MVLAAVSGFHRRLAGPRARGSFVRSAVTHGHRRVRTTLLSLLHARLTPGLRTLATSPKNDGVVTNTVNRTVGRNLTGAPRLHHCLHVVPVTNNLVRSRLRRIKRGVNRGMIVTLGRQLLSTRHLSTLVITVTDNITRVSAGGATLSALVSDVVRSDLARFRTRMGMRR